MAARIREEAMPMNRVQFQPGLSIFEYMERYGTEEKCEAAVAAMRWPDGYRCPRCRGQHAWSFRRGRQSYRECAACGYQCSLFAGTLFESSKLPLSRWFMAMQVLSQAKNNVAALELMRQLGVSLSGSFGFWRNASASRFGFSSVHASCCWRPRGCRTKRSPSRWAWTAGRCPPARPPNQGLSVDGSPPAAGPDTRSASGTAHEDSRPHSPAATAVATSVFALRIGSSFYWLFEPTRT